MPGMTVDRMNRDQFSAKLAPMSEDELRKALWTLYWRGSAPVRERIEAVLTPQQTTALAQSVEPPADASLVPKRVGEFAMLARNGAYLAGDRRVSPKERTRWRFTFRGLVNDSLDALRSDAVDQAGATVATLVDLACEMKRHDYVRSDDPVEAARFVVSDAVAALWSRSLETYGAAGLIERAMPQLVTWESAHGWTRRGDGWVAERETPLAQVLARLLVAPESWSTAAERYFDALGETSGRGRRARGADLAEWNSVLIGHLAGSDREELLDRLAKKPALTRGHVAALRRRPRQLRGEQADG